MNGLDIESLLKSTLAAMRTEDLIVEALRDLAKDEIKRYARKKIDENPELKAQAKQIIAELVEAKFRESYALLRLGKLGAEMGFIMVPEEMKERMEKDIAEMLQREVSQVFDKI